MKVSLPRNDFALAKTALSFGIIVFALMFPIMRYMLIVVTVSGRAHTLGAWIGMWRAGKFTWPFLVWTVAVMAFLSYWIFLIADLPTVALVGFSAFIFHYVYDEFELHRGAGVRTNILLGAGPFAISMLYLFSDTMHLGVTSVVLLAIAIALLLVQLIHLREITWSFIHTNMLSFFIVACSFLKIPAVVAIMVFLIDHYMFWFVYPVYRLHKYNKPERDGFIMILIVIAAVSFFIPSNASPWLAMPTHLDTLNAAAVITLKAIFLGSMAHIFTTAPFTYLFGIGKPRAYAPQA